MHLMSTPTSFPSLPTTNSSPSPTTVQTSPSLPNLPALPPLCTYDVAVLGGPTLTTVWQSGQSRPRPAPSSVATRTLQVALLNSSSSSEASPDEGAETRSYLSAALLLLR